MRAVYFDMDGTIADLYGVEGWLDSLMKGRSKPYREAKPLVNMRVLGKELNRLKKEGYVVGVVSWLAKNSTCEYDELVTRTKLNWLKRHIGAVEWNEVHIVKYGTNKRETVNHPNGILFDDEEGNRMEWNKGNGMAFDVNDIIGVLRAMV